MWDLNSCSNEAHALTMGLMRAARKGGEKERVRLSLDVSPELNDLIEDLAERTDGTKSDVLRRAIALMDVAVKANEQGMKVGVAADDNSLTTEFVGLGVRRVAEKQGANTGSGRNLGIEAEGSLTASI